MVGTSYGSAPEIVQQGVTGFLADADALAGLLPRAAELDRQACRRDVEQRFGAERMVAEHLRLYEELLSGRTSSTEVRATPSRRRSAG